jgi:hypothetical protein
MSRQRRQIPPDEKPYQCGCGRGYMRYPALYTHLKKNKDHEKLDETYKKKK